MLLKFIHVFVIFYFAWPSARDFREVCPSGPPLLFEMHATLFETVYSVILLESHGVYLRERRNSMKKRQNTSDMDVVQQSFGQVGYAGACQMHIMVNEDMLQRVPPWKWGSSLLY